MNLDIQYEFALDWEHCSDMNEARVRLSKITNILNHIIIARQRAKIAILGECLKWKGEDLHKLSWDNKMVKLSELTDSTEKTELWQEADLAYKVIRLKQEQIVEDLYALKKMIDVTPR